MPSQSVGGRNRSAGLNERSQSTLVAAAVAGDRDAFGELYRRFSTAVHGTLLSRLGPADAEDLVQDVFLEGWQKLGQLREPESFGAWMCAIARRRAIDLVRRVAPNEPLPAEMAVAPSAGVDLDAKLALEAIQGLAEAYREPLLLRLLGGLSGEEIAQVTGLTPGSVRVNLHRGFRLLRERMGVSDET